MKSFLEFLAETLSIRHHVHKAGDGSHVIVAYHPDHWDSDSEVAQSASTHIKKHPKGLTASNAIGYLKVLPGELEGTSSARYTQVHSNWRRKGVATGMYDHAQKRLKTSMVPSQSQSEDGKAFWGKYGKKR